MERASLGRPEGGDVRPTPDGCLDREVRLSVTNPTCIAFGGKDLDVFFVTTAWFGPAEAQHTKERQARSLFAFEPGVRGRTKNRYAR